MSTSKWGTGDQGWKTWSAEAQGIRETGRYNGEVIKLTRTSDNLVMRDFTDNVHSGMDLMDKLLPGWQEELDLSTLDLESDENCVLGKSWPMYAKAHDLIETTGSTEYRKFINTVLVGSTNEDRQSMSARLGFGLTDADFVLINSEAINMVAKTNGITPESAIVSQKLASAHKAYELVARYWEALTTTWITEIIKAKVDGRWGSYTVDELDKSIAKTKEVPATA